MTVERIGKRSLLGSCLTGLAIALSPSTGAAQQQGAGQEDTQVAVAPSEAQPQAAPWNRVRIVHVKADRIGEFESLIKELGAALSESSLPGFNVWQVELGELYTYHIVNSMQSIGELAEMQDPPMEPAEWTNWVNRIESTVDAQELMLARIHPDLSIMPEMQQGAEMPELLLLMTQTILPGRAQEYENWLREEVLPALRQSETSGVVANRMSFGADDRTWVFAVPIESWSELDQPSPLHQSMGEQAAEEMLSRGEAMVERSETIVLRTRPDLAAGEGTQ